MSNSVSIPASSEVFCKRASLEIIPDRNYKMISVRITVTAETHPSVVQIILYGPDEVPCYASKLHLVPLGRNVVFHTRWPRSTDWFPSNKDQTCFAIRNACPSKTQTGGIITAVFETRLKYGPDIDDRQCPAEFEVRPLVQFTNI